MAEAVRKDPYKTFRFKVEWDGKTVAGVNSVSAMSHTTDVIEYRNGNEEPFIKSAPGQTNYDPVTIERGLTNDKEFHEWAGTLDPRAEYKDNFRKDIKIILCDVNGTEAITFKLSNCWISDYQALSDLDADDNSIAIESITIEHEGFNYTDVGFDKT
ncbi:phage tail protein [Desulfonema magnum]|uniref:Phage tail protein n=1 Tax=Desulfonema magnum TaxID=45655 RepID=A0A975BP74_9BACT|nr:phage tail protein [Desulfonema magnum]QTA89108.1 Phage tail protein [Desulfonema magnum]